VIGRIIVAAELMSDTWPEWLRGLRRGGPSDGGADLVIATDCVSIRVRLADSRRAARPLRDCPGPAVVIVPARLSSGEAWRRVLRLAEKLHGRHVRRLKRSAPVKTVNRARQAVDRLRFFGPPERETFVKALPCAVTRQPGPCDQAHVIHTRGSRLARPELIVPMKRAVHDLHGSMAEPAFEARFGVDLRALAAETEARWQDELQRRAER
jgi:hypothetical protein